MRSVFTDAVAEAAERGKLPFAAVCWREIRDWPVTLVREYWSSFRHKRKDVKMSAEIQRDILGEKAGLTQTAKTPWRDAVLAGLPHLHKTTGKTKAPPISSADRPGLAQRARPEDDARDHGEFEAVVMTLGSPPSTKMRIGLPNLFGAAATSCGLRTATEGYFRNRSSRHQLLSSGKTLAYLTLLRGSAIISATVSRQVW